jgi:hypothetical protein
MKNIYKIYDMTEIFNIKENIYITNDEPAYPYALHLKNQEVFKTRAVGSRSLELYHDKGFSYPEECKKIILTTDQDLIKDGVQAIDDEFLEWFIKNQSCEEVGFNTYHVKGDISGKLHYQIIIPKEEPKQETIEDIKDLYLMKNVRLWLKTQQDLADKIIFKKK